MNDLQLAQACAAGDRSAQTELIRRFGATVRNALLRHGLSADEADDTEQQLWTRVLVSRPPRQPAIAGYAGLGSLAGWLKTCAMRDALSLRRAKACRPSAVSLDENSTTEALGAHVHPEGDCLRAEWGGVFAQAFTDAVATLQPSELALLREHTVHGQHLEQMAEVRGVHRTTVMRWLDKMKHKLRMRTNWAVRTATGHDATAQWTASDLRISQVLRPVN